MSEILVLWATPRSTSTPFEWMMRERGDFAVLHEPFNEVFYYGEDRISGRDAHIPARPGLTFASVWRDIEARARNERVFMKEFVYSVQHLLDDAFVGRFRHAFLIRDPAKSLPSLFAHWPDFTLDEAGYESLHALFERLWDRDGKPPPVIDSDDFLDAPRAVVEAYCAAMDIPFLDHALEWQPGQRREVSWYDCGSWHDRLRGSTGIARQQRSYVAIDHDDHLKRAYDACRPLYDAMHAHRIAAAPPAAEGQAQ